MEDKAKVLLHWIFAIFIVALAIRLGATDLLAVQLLIATQDKLTASYHIHSYLTAA